jgi:hypothetical protein
MKASLDWPTVGVMVRGSVIRSVSCKVKCRVEGEGLGHLCLRLTQ